MRPRWHWGLVSLIVGYSSIPFKPQLSLIRSVAQLTLLKNVRLSHATQVELTGLSQKWGCQEEKHGQGQGLG